MQNPTDTIKKLLRLAQSANENEAALAAERAAELALKYGINLSQVNTSEHPHKTEDGFTLKNPSQWVSNIIAGVCLVNACDYYRWATPSDVTYRLVGRPHAIEATRLIASYLIEAVKRLNREHVTAYHYTTQQRADYRKAFRLAASQRLYARLHQKHQSLQSQANQTKAQALVVQNYYQNELAIIQTLLPDDLKTIQSRGVTLRSHEGIADGIKAGNAISLNDQVTTHAPLVLTRQ